MKTWREIEKDFTTEFPFVGTDELDFDGTFVKNEIKSFFKDKFKQILEEMVGEEHICCGEHRHTTGLYIPDCTASRQEMLSKIEKFFE